ncbi:hypothetical protein OEA41_010410 [Lepraria neglecta]|uniref:Uncharacterized protein n=1 Tax=Lepraria neglecta TaxID=209136 RepID=A0AAD9YZ09_9LECA|nr:hypothetical protein OEA41_010410 [Lepraria neglecta]
MLDNGNLMLKMNFWLSESEICGNVYGEKVIGNVVEEYMEMSEKKKKDMSIGIEDEDDDDDDDAYEDGCKATEATS